MSQGLLLIAGRLHAGPWKLARVSIALAESLARRGRSVTLACESIEDPAPLAALGIRVIPRTGYCARSSLRPRAFVAFARDHLIAHAGPKLSLSRLVAAPHWLPLGPAAGAHTAELSRRAHVHEWVHLARALPRRAVAMTLERSALDKREIIRTLFIPGPAQAAAWREEHPALAPRIVELPPLSCTPVAPERSALRARLRHALNIDPARHVALLSAHRGLQRSIRPFLRGLRQAGERLGSRAPIVLWAVEDALAAQGALASAGAMPWLRIVGVTYSPQTLLSAADALILPTPALVSGFHHGGAHRALADAMLWGLPVLAHPQAPGIELIASTSAGLIAGGSSPAAWCAALSRLDDRAWLSVAANASARAGALCTIDQWTDAIERHLGA